jgi:hypothetical protein
MKENKNPGASTANQQEQNAETLPSSDEMARNPNPRANENIRVRTSPPEPGPSPDEVGSEITDGEDG